MCHSMRPKLINNCSKKYVPDQIIVTNKILDKIPDKFLLGLNEIVFHDRSNDPVIKYVLGQKAPTSARIEIFMGGFSKGRKYSLFHYNCIFLPTITDHIVKYLKPTFDDPEIQTVVRYRYNPKWVYLGPYLSILMAPLNFMRFLYNRFSFFHLWMNRMISNFLKKHSGT